MPVHTQPHQDTRVWVVDSHGQSMTRYSVGREILGTQEQREELGMKENIND
jgi:hypothetical protein